MHSFIVSLRERVFILVNDYSILFLFYVIPLGVCVRASLGCLSGAAAAAKIYLESLSRVAKQAQQGTCGGTADIGKNKITFHVFTYIFLFLLPLFCVVR